jgi:hypothetical protein
MNELIKISVLRAVFINNNNNNSNNNNLVQITTTNAPGAYESCSTIRLHPCH